MADGKTYFVVSDVHSYYTPMKKALDEAGYDSNNENHIIIMCGDMFDRGPETLKMLKFFRLLPKDRRILIRGNHEYLLKDCYERGGFYDYDESNGTARTMCHLCGFDPDFRINMYRKLATCEDTTAWRSEYDELWRKYLEKPFKSRKIKQVIDWIFSDEWVNYFELGKYVFVHSWVPLKTYFDDNYVQKEKVRKDWRDASDDDWNKASWGCPWKHYLNGVVPEDKTIVCGHWHVQDFHLHLGHDADGYKNRNIYFSDRLIAIDACTAMDPHLCNVLVIEGDKCYDQHRKALN